MTRTPCSSGAAGDGWHLVRLDDCGVRGRQPHIRATGNRQLDPSQLMAEDEYLSAAESFLELAAVYHGLDPDALYRLEVVYGSPLGEPRLQSLEVRDQVIHPPRALPEGRTERLIHEIGRAANQDGRLKIVFRSHERPELAGLTEQVALPAIVNRVALYADAPAYPLVIDAATLPDGGVLVRVQTPPMLEPIPDAIVRVELAGEAIQGRTDARGQFGVLRPDLIEKLRLGDLIAVSVQAGDEMATTDIEADDAFFSTWPTLVLPDVNPEGEQRTTWLDGTWLFHPEPPTAATGTEVDERCWRPIEVPGQWVQQGFDVGPGAHACYRRTFDFATDAERVYRLRFDAVYAHARVFLNGAEICSHEGGFTPFEVDVTNQIRTGRNVLAVLVRSDSISDHVSAASDYAAHLLGGISRSVRIIDLPRSFLGRLHVQTLFDEAGDGTVQITGRVDGLVSNQIWIVFEILDPAGGSVATSDLELETGTKRFTHEVLVVEPQHWTAEHPNLYTLKARVSVRGASPTTVERRFGFRQIEVDRHSLRVNGRPIRLRGVERHEQDPLRGRSTLPDLWRRDVELMKDANVNNVFTCHYPPAEGFLDLCDSEGLWVIDESPCVWVTASIADDPTAFLALTGPILEMMERDWSRPSVIAWVLGDECQWGRNFWRLHGWLQMQKLRTPLIFSFDIGGDTSLDIASRHYPGSDFDRTIAGIDRPVTFDQHCHVNCYNRRELVTDPELRDWWGNAIETVWSRICGDDRVIGGQIWAWSDDEFWLGDATVVGYGQWGVVDAWRRPKPEWWHLKMAYAPVRLSHESVSRRSSESIHVELENRYDFTGLEHVTAHWTAGHLQGETACVGEARSKGYVDIPVPAGYAGELEIRFVDWDGRVVNHIVLPAAAGSEPTDMLPDEDPGTERSELVVAQLRRARVFAPNLPEFDVWKIGSGNTEWQIDQETGVIRAGRIGRETVVCGGPELMLLESTATQLVGPHHRLGIRELTRGCGAFSSDAIDSSWAGSNFEIRVSGRYTGVARGAFILRINRDGSLDIEYEFVALRSIDLRQGGVVVDVLPAYDRIEWHRKAQWSYYPADHIGRPSGHAVAHERPEPDVRRVSGRIRPDWPWSLDRTALGTNDFRATRRDVDRFSLTSSLGAGLEVVPTARTDVRVWLEGDIVRLLAASHSSGGSEPFLKREGHVERMARRVESGEAFAGAVRLVLAACPITPG